MAKASKKTTEEAATKKETTPAKKTSGKTTTKAPAKKTASKASEKKVEGKAAGGLKAPLTPSPALAKAIGSGPAPRTEIIKKIWDYIKQHNLQDPNNKRMINADENLKKIFEGKEQVSMFELAGIINKQIK